MKQLVWVTPDCFVDCDIILMPGLLKHFNIHWIVLLAANSRYKESDFDYLAKKHDNLAIEFIYEEYRQRNPLNILTYLKLSRHINRVKADAAYLNVVVNPWRLVMLPFIKSESTVVTAHQGRVHEGMGHKKVVTWARKHWYGHFKNVNMFSKSQAALLKQDFPKARIYQFVLGLKDFGSPTKERPVSGCVRFLSFGTLNYAKNIDLLIDAACLLYERGVRGFKVSINGACRDWSWYQQHIKYPEIFELDIRMIDNSEIPNLFNGSHYLVQPYRVVSQSGPMKIAFNYNLPVIVPNLPGFMDELEEGVNGYSFECGSVDSLADRMQRVFENHTTDYQPLLERMKDYTKTHYSEDILIEQYKDMMEEVMTAREANLKRPFTLKVWLKNSRTILFLRLIHEKMQELWIETRYLANGNRYEDKRKMKTDLQIRVHAIEKGMSIGKLKEGFGNQKACDIVDGLCGYLAIDGDRQFVIEACSVLCRYVAFKEEIGQRADDVKVKLTEFMNNFQIKPIDKGGVYRLSLSDIRGKAQGCLPDVIASRFAVRDFGDKPIDMGLLRKALQTAEKSPSACNRQSWRVHVYTGNSALTLFNLQGGGKSFAREMQAAILICGDLTSYHLNETNLPYVDGSLYGMNLMLALHYYGLASIPLTMGCKIGYLKKIKRAMGIPRNEMPVLLIGVGSYKDEFRAAVSLRYPYTQYTTFEE